MISRGLKDLDEENLSELKALADSIRAFLIESTATTGGHIGANLGTVELTIALHRCFTTPKDKLIFDTGHTGYTHKILTGRKKLFSTLNSLDGMSRFLSRTESVHDFGDSSHAGNSISFALGHSLSTRDSLDSPWTVAIIGDGALAEGLALEALNHASVSGVERMMIIINDNGFAISPGFGAIHEALGDREKSSRFFESLGYSYFGPIDGHNLESLIEAFEKAKKSKKQIPVVHVKTEKGRGFPPALKSPNRMHYSLPFDPRTGEPSANANSGPGPLPVEVAANAVLSAMETNPRLLCMTPSTRYATGLDSVFRRFPDRCFDPGMAEQHMLSMAVGAAISGSPVVVFYQSTFLQRAYDQLIHDLAFLQAPVLLVSVRHGFAGFDHSTHHGLFDIPVIRSVPNTKMLNPITNADVVASIESWTHAKSPGAEIILLPYVNYDISVGNALTTANGFRTWKSGQSVLIVGTGVSVGECRKAADLLAQSNICQASVLAVSQINPLPETLLSEIEGYSVIVTVEEGLLSGGFGESLKALSNSTTTKVKFRCLGVPGEFAPPGDTSSLRQIYGLDAESIYKTVEQALN